MSSQAALEAILKVKFQNPQLLHKALVHRSYLNENKKEASSNERLEFLGDSVLSLLVSTELYCHFPSHPEGKLTSIRSLLVKTKTLAAVASSLTLGEFPLINGGEEQGGGRTNTSLLADTLEAVVGAIYLDAGLEAAKKFLARCLFPLISQVERNEDLLDYKSTLQEIIQEKSKLSPTYEVTAERGPDHDKTFEVSVSTGGEKLASGIGKSKQEAEQAAAHAALEKTAHIK